MKNVEISSNSTWTPLKINDKHDSTLTFGHKSIDPVDGISLRSTFAQQYSVDSVTDTKSSMLLTDQIKIDDIVKIELPGSRYPEQFTTYLLANAYPTIDNNSAYIYIFEKDEQDIERDHMVGVRTSDFTVGDHVFPATGKQTYRWAQETNDNAIYYSVTLHDDTTASVNHDDNINNVYMTAKLQSDQQTVLITFETNETGTPQSNQIFNYYINKDQGFIIFYININSVVYYVTPVTDNAGVLMAIPATDIGANRYPQQSVIRYIPYVRNTTDHKLFNNWVSYQTSGDTNNLNINLTKSYQDVTNNYLLVSQYQNISRDTLPVDIIQLKNQLTVTGNTNRNNPFPNLRDVDHREYDKILMNEHLDKDSGLNLNYSSYETEVTLEPDRITYFNAPQNMYPYDKININDSGLIESGAIGGDTPINSDKIFKKAASYKYNTPNGMPTDEDTGTWLCSWLKSNIGVDWNETSLYRENVIVNFEKKVYRCKIENTGQKPSINPDEWEETDNPPPVWVDRYYNPEKFSTQQALEIEGQYSSYTTKFESIVDMLGAENKYIFDKISDLTFEPGSLYAYYRLGEKQIATIIENTNTNMIHDGISPAYNQNRVLQTNIDDEITFNRDQYIETVTPSNITNSDFTISFQMYRDDWSKPFAGQFLGNYTNQGVGVFNKQNLTPYILLRGADSVFVYNTNMDLIMNPPISNVNSVVKLPGNEDIIMFDSVSATTYDMKGMLVESTVFDDDIMCATIDNNSYYILDGQNAVTRWDLYDETQDQLNRPYPYNLVIGSIEHLNSLDGDFSWELSQKTYIQSVDDGTYQFRINCDNYTIDNDKSVWFSKNNRVFKYTLSNRLGVNASWSGIVGEQGVGVGQSEVLLVATENFEGFKGNEITLYGDGVSTLFNLITEWNQANRDNTVNLVRGNSSAVPVAGPDGVIKLSGGVNRGSGSVFSSLSATDTVNSIKCDYDNNIHVLYDHTKLSMMDSLRNINSSVDLRNLNENVNQAQITQACMDLVTEVDQQRGYNTYQVVLLRDSDDNVHFFKLDINSAHTLREYRMISLPTVDLNAQHDITCFENYRWICQDTIHTNNLIFQFKYQSYFDTDKTKLKKLVVNTDDFSSGYHHFAFSFNSVNSNLSLFVDGVLRDAQTSDDAASGSAYKFSRSIHDPILVGSEPFFNNVTFSERLRLDHYSFAGDFKLRNYRVYNEYLNFQKIKMLSREKQQVRALNLTLPAGKRNFVDHAEKFYKHRKPGSKSKDFNINITNDSIVDVDQQKHLANKLIETVNEALPANSSINKINWIT